MLRKVIIGAISVLVLIVAYNLLIQITDAVRSQERLSAQANLVYKLEAKNQSLKNQLSQTKSDDFIEEQARNKLSLSKSGETVVIIPDSMLKLVMGASNSAQEVRLPNWLGWWRVFFR